MTAEVADGQTVEVSFRIKTEDLLTTKAIGEAAMHKELHFGVYKHIDGAESVYLPDAHYVISHFGNGLTATVTATLVTGQSYDFAFWAQSTDSDYYTVDFAGKKVTVNYDALSCNDENRDAFCAVVEGYKVVSADLTEDIVLRRPLAQINVGTTSTDIDLAGKAGVKISETKVVVEGIANTLDLFTGKTSGSATVEFAAAELPAEKLIVNKGTASEAEYVYLALNYVLVNDGSPTGYDKAMLGNDAFAVTFYEDGREINTIAVDNVPIRRNYRTNIIGQDILTDNVSLTIIIDPLFYGEYDYNYKGYDINKVLYKTADNEYALDTPEQLSFLAEVVNGGYNDFNGITIKVVKDIDLAGWEWTPIGTDLRPFKGILDGTLPTKADAACATITGLKVNRTNGAAGLFGTLNGTVKNLNLNDVEVNGSFEVGAVAGRIFNDGLIENVNVENAVVNGNHWVGGIAGYVYGSVNNCSVNEIKVTALPNLYGNVYDNGDKVGGIIGLYAADNADEETVSGNAVTNAEIKGYRDLGGIAGAARADLISGNSVAGTKIIVDQQTNSYGEKDANAAEIVGRILEGELGQNNTADSVEIVK